MDFDDIDETALEEFFAANESVAESKVQTGNIQPGPEHLEVLSRCFGHKKFRPFQWEIISAIINNRRDVCAIMATGYGKSLCYQYPSVFLGGLTLVISPLISLMEDQILSLTVSNIPACLLGSAQTSTVRVYEDIFLNAYNLIYLTPEFCCGDRGQEMLQKMSRELKITLIAIDEAHCISFWGHDFRKEFRRLGVLQNIFPNTPIMAVTATATPIVREDIIKSLNLRNPLSVCTSFDRPNLYFEINMKKGCVSTDIARTVIQTNGKWAFSGPTIIYCIRRDETEEVADMLKQMGINCLPYHAGMPLKDRKNTHEMFIKDKIDVVVGTIAFGMGIDKPDVRNVIHYGSSKSLESYYQEVGRAGRDGLPARCITFYSQSDFNVFRSMGENKSRTEDNIKGIKEYFYTRECRRKYILNFFGEKMDDCTGETKKSNCCDNCKNRNLDSRSDHEKYEGLNEKGEYNFGQDAKLFIQAVSAMNSYYALGSYIKFLRGLKLTKSPKYHSHPLYGSGKHKTEIWWKAVAELLIKEKYLIEVKQNLPNSFITYFKVELAPKGREFLLRSEATLFSKPPPTVFSFLKLKPQVNSSWLSTKPEQPSTSKELPVENQAEVEQRMKLYRKLLNRRAEVAAELDCMPYTVASNTALMQMARFKPKNIIELRELNCDGLTEAKVAKFGEKFLKVIDPNSSTELDSLKETSIREILLRHPLPNVSCNMTSETSCRMFLSENSPTVEEVARKRGVVASTIVNHLTNGIKIGFPIKLSRLNITADVRDVIMKTFKRLYDDFTDVKLQTMKTECPPEVSFDQLKAVLAYYEVRRHLNNVGFPYEEFEDFQFKEPEIENLQTSVFGEDEDETDQKLSDLLDMCNELVKNEEDSELTGVKKESEDEDDDEPKCKKEKIDFGSILDSPPRSNESGLKLKESQNSETVEKTEGIVSNGKNNVGVISGSKSKKKNLPPWLVTKKIN